MANEDERKKAFLVYASTYEAAVKHLSSDQMGELFVKLGKISFEGENVGSDHPVVDSLLISAKPNMDAAERRHLAAIENGKKGKDRGGGPGRPYKGETREEYQVRVSAWKESLEGGGNNPQKPLNKETDVNRDMDKTRNKYIKNKTNVELIPSSVLSSPSYYNSSRFEEDITKHGEEPGQGTSPEHQSFSDYSKMEGDMSKPGEEPRLGERPRHADINYSNGMSDFLHSITLDDSNLEDDVPPCPPDPRFMNYVGNIQDFIRYDCEPNYEGMTDAEMMDAIKETIDDALECQARRGKDQHYWDLMHRAKKIYMHLNGCSEDDAKNGISRIYIQRQMEQRGK